MNVNNYNEKCVSAPCEKPKSPSTPTEEAVSNTTELIEVYRKTLYNIEDRLLKLGYFDSSDLDIDPGKSQTPIKLYETICTQNEKLADLNYRLIQCLNLLINYV